MIDSSYGLAIQAFTTRHARRNALFLKGHGLRARLGAAGADERSPTPAAAKRTLLDSLRLVVHRGIGQVGIAIRRARA
ncbi:MAG TPA: hypothetical protein VM619_15790 [Luteimonas sp.]|nr:hypothetical protein [Luteimonas sp.]